MTMAIDTLKAARRLREAGFSEPQAEALVATVVEGAEDAELATKRDVSDLETALRSDMRDTEHRLNAQMREMELRLKVEIEAGNSRTQARLIGIVLGALGVNILAMLGAMLGLAKLLGH
jgi:hypothetical protein